MNLKLDCQEFTKNLVKVVDLWGGIQYQFKFDNGYGASVVKHLYSYGSDEDLWELAVLKCDNHGHLHLVYDTEITSDVEGYLTDEEVRNLLHQIEELT